MADRYATNAFNNFSQFEKGVFKAGEEQTILTGDNPAFIWPPNNRRIAAGGFLPKDKDGKEVKGTNNQSIQRGYMRMLSQGFSNSSALERRRLHFQFNPESVNRSVSARNDIQLWMNQDPVQLTQAIPGDANFSFELFFNREAEVNSGSYRAGRDGPVTVSNAEASLALTDAVSKPVKASDVTDLGVLADLMVFDEIIGQGVNSQLIASIVANAKKVNVTQRNAAAAASTSEPTKPAKATATVVGGKVTAIQVTETGAGYVIAPTITISDASGQKATAKASFANGKITQIVVTNGGSNYAANPTVVFSGGGSGGGSATKDGQDQTPAEFDEAKATKAINANFGNSAFLVSLPVRIVFSSLFMVEGYITSTNVTFNKFNPNMVPTQCVVGITMQALYIGFAREKTYLTTTLDEALKASVVDETESESKDVVADAKGLKNIGNDLFKKVGESDIGPNGFTNYDSKLNPEKYLENDYTYSFSMKYFSSDSFKAELKRGTIESVSQEATLIFTYKGNSVAGSTPGSFSVGKTIEFKSTGSMKLDELSSTGRFKDGSTSIENKFSLKDNPPLAATQDFDKTTTSLWDVSLTILFTIKSKMGNELLAEQKFIAKTPAPISFRTEFTGRKNGVFNPVTKGGKG